VTVREHWHPAHRASVPLASVPACQLHFPVKCKDVSFRSLDLACSKRSQPLNDGLETVLILPEVAGIGVFK
jgi:hypothetical protein